MAIHRACVLTLILAAATATGSAATEGVLAVSARVLPRTTLRVSSAPLDLIISARDVRRAYVDVREPTLVDISNNNPRGYALLVVPRMQGFTAMVVRGAGLRVTLGGGGGAIPERGQVGAHIPLVLRYRLILDQRIEPGRYPWPLRLTVRPLSP